MIALISTILTPARQVAGDLLSPKPVVQEVVLAEHTLDLNTRAAGEYVNEVFKFNILLTIEKFDYGFTLEPGEVFAFHDIVRPEFKDEPLKTGWTSYEAKEGYQTVLGLAGNGVCHLATLMNWTASEADLEVTAPVSHNFVPVPEVPREYGTSIRYCQSGCNSPNQNLYIKNNFDFPVKFIFQTSKDKVRLRILKERND